VFPAPCRPAIYAPSYEAASQLNLELTRKRRLSRQTWAIYNKIREVDELLLGQEAARSNIREIHPEVCFGGLAGHAMRYPKRLPEGFAERRRVLQSAYPFADSIFLDALPYLKNRGVARDDVLDALSAAITARLARSRLMSLPDVPEIDTHGLRMEMVYHQATPVQHSLV
jgi:predicted RNase H-like nuclease